MIIHKYAKIAKLTLIGWTSLWLQAAVHTNALIHEPSPYLQQHAHNPVNWYPWGKEALEKAKKEHKLIFLSIGYSTCHWCHVMEEESFTDMQVATLLNRDFIAIKVDREQHPQIDKKYQRIYQIVHGKRGGWPLSVFLTPKMEVLDIRTYIPKEERYGSEGLLKLLPKLAGLRQNSQLQQHRVALIHAKMTQVKKRHLPQTFSDPAAVRFLAQVNKAFDTVHGGFAKHPKFPEASKLETLMSIYRLDGNVSVWKMVEKTLDAMARGGIYDQVGGGFFRYATDRAWEYPHFEKMLYTNAQMIDVYVKAYLLSGKPLYKRIVTESIAAMQEGFGRQGLYFSALDADSSGEEGGYYLYNYAHIREALLQKGWSPKVVDANLAYYGIEEDGNMDGELSLPHLAGLPEPPMAEAFKKYLKRLRKTRLFPFSDKKINTAWNAMMVKALFAASDIDRHYLAAGEKSLARLWHTMFKNGLLYHQTMSERNPTQKGLLEDYAYLTAALIEAYEHTYKSRYLEQAKTLAKNAIAKFYKSGKWYLSDDKVDVEADFDDRYYTSPLSVMLENLVTLSEFGGDPKWYDIAIAGAVPQGALSKMPQCVSLLLRLKRGDVIVHANKAKLLETDKQLKHIGYPFVLSQPEESSEYLACTRTSCFAHTPSIEKLKAAIAAYTKKQPQGAYRWQK